MRKPEIQKKKIPDYSQMRQFSKDPIYTDIMKMTWPVLMELVLGSVFGMIDMMMLGNIPNSSYAAAAVSTVGLTLQPLFLGLAVVQALNVGGTAMIARYYGANQKDRMENVLKHVMILSILFSLPIAVFGFFNAGSILAFMGGGADAIAIGTNYFRIICISYLFQSFNISITGALRGIGETKVPMNINLRVNFLNGVGNVFLIYGLFFFPTMGVVGAAISTGTANLIASILLVRFLMSGKSELNFSFKRKFHFHKKTIKNLIHIGLPSAGEQLIMRTGAILFIQIVSSLGTAVFAAHQIGMSILSLSFTLGMAFGISASSLVGRSLGKDDPKAAVDYGTMAGKIGSFCGGLLGIFFFVGAEFIVGLYSSDPEIVQNGATALRIVALVQPFQANQLVSAGSLRGAGDTMFPLISTFAGILVIRVLTAYLLVNVLGLGLMGAWIAIVFDQFIRWGIIAMRFKSGRWKHVVIH